MFRGHGNWVAVALMGVMTTLGCNADILDVRKKNDGNNSFQNPNAGAQTPATGQPAVGPVPVTDPANLAPYLLKRTEASGLKPFIEAYVLPDPNQIPDRPVANASPNFPALVGGVSEFFAGLFAKPSMQPGRNMKVFIIDDKSLNASCDSFQKVRLNTGLVNVKNSALTSLVLCHEISHSARNHVVKSLPLAEKIFGTSAAPNPEMDQIDAAIQAYMTKAHNPTQGVYTHRKAEFDPLLKRFKDHVRPYEQESKKHESEADVLGSFLCAQAGMKAEQWLNAYQTFVQAGQTSAGSGLQDGSQVPDGGQLKVTTADLNDFIVEFLFSIDSHPSDQERLDQFKRLSDLMVKEQDLAAKTFADLVTKLNAASGGTSLYEEELSESDMGIKRYPSLDGGPDVVVRRPFDLHGSGRPGRAPAFRFR